MFGLAKVPPGVESESDIEGFPDLRFGGNGFARSSKVVFDSSSE
jgi:hypothetical protein